MIYFRSAQIECRNTIQTSLVFDGFFVDSINCESHTLALLRVVVYNFENSDFPFLSVFNQYNW